MHKRSKNTKTTSTSDIQSKETSVQSGSTGRKGNMPCTGSKGRTTFAKAVCSWFASFTKLFLTIGFLIALVYLYDERIIYGFAGEMGWLEKLPLSREYSPNQPNSDKTLHEKSQVDNTASQNEQVVNKILQDVPVIDTAFVKRNEKERVKVPVKEILKEMQSETPNANSRPRYDILQVLTNSDKHPHLKTRFDVCMRSILDKSSLDLHFFFVVDLPSAKFIMECLQEITDERISKSQFKFTFLHVDTLGQKLLPFVGELQAQLRGSHPYYTDTIFFLSMGIHQHVLPKEVKKLIIMDTDLKFMSDIRLLFDLFNSFSEDNVMGIAHEQQPVYRHLLSLYRSQNRGTIVGDPPPNGLTGFNSGVMLLDFEKMRSSQSYKDILSVDFIKEYSAKYHFKGHLGDQDFFTLVSLERPELFFVLPCSWNKQLCIWWKDKGYESVFDLYFNCPKPIHVYHGNCNTPIPH